MVFFTTLKNCLSSITKLYSQKFLTRTTQILKCLFKPVPPTTMALHFYRLHESDYSKQNNSKTCFHFKIQLKSVVNSIKSRGCRWHCSITRDGRALALFEEEKNGSIYFPFFSPRWKFKNELWLTHFLASRIFLNRISHLTIKECSAGLAIEVTCVGKKKEKSDKNLTSHFGKA